jgi:hypothetical protein
MITLPANVERALNEAEAIARSRLAKFPYDGVSLHTIEQLELFRAAWRGGAAEAEALKSGFDLGLMAAKALGADEDETFADRLFEIDAYVRAM